MIGKGNGLPTLAMNYESPDLPDVAMVQVAADSIRVTVAYLNANGVALDVREYSVRENPELACIVRFTYFDDVWDMELVLSIIEPLDAEEPACDSAPEWKFVQWQPADQPAFINLPEVYAQVAS